VDGDVRGRIILTQESRKEARLYFVERAIWAMDLSSLAVTKVSSVALPGNSQLTGGFIDADGTGTALISSYTMCAASTSQSSSTSLASSDACVPLHAAPGAPLVEYMLYAVELASGSVTKSANTGGAEWLVKWPGFDASATATPGMRLQSVTGPPASLSFVMFDFASFTSGTTGTDTSSRMFAGHRLSFASAATATENRCAYLASVDTKDPYSDIVRVTQYILPSASNGAPPAPKVAYQINAPATVGQDDNFSGWLATDWSFVYLTVNHTIFRYTVSC